MFKNNRKGVELTINVLIIAVVSLLVLMLLAFLLFKGFGNWNTGTSCATHDGECKPITTSCSEISKMTLPYSCGKNEKCCGNVIGEDAAVPVK